MGVFARGWLGLGVCANVRVRLWCLWALVCAFAWGWWDNHCLTAPAPALLGWLVLTRPCGLEKRVRGGVCPMGGGRLGGGGTWLSRHHALLGGTATVVCAWKREGWGAPWSGEHNPTPSLVLAYMETGSHPVGAKQRGGATGRAWWPGWGRGAFLVVALACSLAWCIQLLLLVAGGRRLNLACVGTLASVRAIAGLAGGGGVSGASALVAGTTPLVA